jgi:hypothetical protein
MNPGGVIVSMDPIPVWIGLTECLLRPDDKGVWHCHRALHEEHPHLCQART